MDGKIRVYDAGSFEMIDSLFDPNFSEIEFYKINDSLLEITFYQKEMPSKFGIYDLDLKLVHSIGLTLPYERKIRSVLDASNNLYQISSYYKSNIVDPRNDGLIPVLRKISLQDEWPFSSPELEITDVTISNPNAFGTCLTNDLNNVCIYSFENLYYYFTVQNNGNEIIDNFGHYVGTVSPTFCGYFYQDYRYYQDFSLAPGQSMTIKDSIRLHWVAEAPKLNCYVVGPNHLLSDHEGSVYTVEDISTSIFQSNPPEPLSIYPNPVADFLTINQLRSSPNPKIEIFSISGQKINLLNNEWNTIDTSKLKPGMYYIRMLENQKTYLGSFVKME
ncbi:MAG: T9SS type A sorting domain-containing protein [Saprospiraceae bacterium]|nr:T9SS type A sorting domain-containing protein [Saprospiraceae bacterium]